MRVIEREEEKKESRSKALQATGKCSLLSLSLEPGYLPVLLPNHFLDISRDCV